MAECLNHTSWDAIREVRYVPRAHDVCAQRAGTEWTAREGRVPNQWVLGDSDMPAHPVAAYHPGLTPEHIPLGLPCSRSHNGYLIYLRWGWELLTLN